jgi:hypothetical protein
MTDQDRSPGGYRGALPERGDRLARPWVVTVIAIFVLMFVLALAGVPSSLIPESSPTPLPLPSVSASVDASASASASVEASAAASP